jgi:flagellar basal-body rod modification protein FlgD
MSIPSTEGVGVFGAGAATAAAAPGSTGSTGGTSSTDQMNKDMFLKLMVAQLKNQDPMNPTDSSQFLAQTAQFTSLEKLDAVASQTAQALTAQMAFGASSLVGRSVTYTGTDGAQATGSVDSVRFTSSGPVLGVGGTDVALADVVKVAG